jgi:hypothetical protein
VWHVGVQLWGFPEEPPLIPLILLGILVVVCFVASIRILWSDRCLVENSKTTLSLTPTLSSIKTEEREK